MFCAYCGTKLIETDKFCTMCGAKNLNCDKGITKEETNANETEFTEEANKISNSEELEKKENEQFDFERRLAIVAVLMGLFFGFCGIIASVLGIIKCTHRRYRIYCVLGALLSIANIAFWVTRR